MTQRLCKIVEWIVISKRKKIVSGLTILFIIIALIIGVVIGFFGARRYMENYLRNNPPITEEMLRSMMMQMGQKPSNRKLHQMMQMMKVQAKKANK